MKSAYPAAVAFACALFLARCTGGTEPDDNDADGLTIVSGNGQSAAPSATLPIPLTVNLVENGMPAAGESVQWTVTAGGGTLSASSTTTDASGRASTTWTLGPNAGSNRVEASVAGPLTSSVQFAATAVTTTPAPSAVSVTVGDFFFDPSSARLAIGGTVTWNWSGAAGHNVTFDTGTSSSTQVAGTFSRTFTTAGSFTYRCTIHAQMTGSIAVE